MRKYTTRLARPCLFVALLISATPVRADCLADEVLLYEDDAAWYCQKIGGPEVTNEIASDLDRHLLDGPRDEMLGVEWQFRKQVIEAVGRLARQKYPYLWGGKLILRAGDREVNVCFADDCPPPQDVHGVDCSGSAAYGMTKAVCLLEGFRRLSGSKMSRLPGKNAAGLYDFFRMNGAFISTSGQPAPGDMIFFRLDEDDPSRVSHVAIYVGKHGDGTMRLLNAGPKMGVAFINMPGEWYSHLAGYGNTSKLFLNGQ